MSVRKICLAAVLLSACTVNGQGLREARRLLQYQRYQSAIDLLSTLHQKNPADLPVTYWLGIAYIENDDADTALSILSDSALDTNNPLLRAGRAEALAAAGDPAEARQQFNVRVLQPAKINDPLTALAMGRALSRLNDFQQAGYFLDRSFSLRDDPDILMILADNAAKKRKDADANDFAKDALALQPRYAPALYFLAKQSLKEKDTSLTISYLTKTIEADSLYTPAWQLRYRIAWKRKSPGLSNDYLHYLELSDPDSARISALAPVFYNAGRYNDVIALVHQPPAHSPQGLSRYAAYSHIQLHQYQEAFEALHTYAADVPEISKTDHRLLALLASRFYIQYPDALPIIERAYDSETDTAYRAYYAQVLQQAWQHQPGKALTWQLHRLKPIADRVTWIQTAMGFYRAGDYPAADSLAAVMTRQFPDQAAGWYLRAFLASGKQHETVNTENLPWLENFIRYGVKDSTISKQQRIAVCSLLVNWYHLHHQNNKALLYVRTWLQAEPHNKTLQQQMRRWQ